MANAKLDWKNVNVKSPKLQALLEKVKSAQAALKDAREKFEAAAKSGISVPKGQMVVFSHRFGKVAVAFTDQETAKKVDDDALTL